MCLNAGFLFWVLCSKRSHWCIAMLVSLTIQNVRPLNTHWMSNQVRVWPIRDSDLVVMCGWRPLWHGSGARFKSKSKSKIWSKPGARLKSLRHFTLISAIVLKEVDVSLFVVFLTFFLISFALFKFSKKQNNAKWDCSLFIRHSFTSAFSFVFVDVCFAHSTLFHVFYLKSAVPCDDSPAVSPGLFWLV